MSNLSSLQGTRVVVVCLLALLASASDPSLAKAGGSTAVGAASQTAGGLVVSPAMIAQEPLDRSADAIHRFLGDQKLSGYAGTEVRLSPSPTLLLYWKG